MHKILNYIRNMKPETARKNNTESGIKTIKEEINAELKYLKSCKDTFLSVGMREEAKGCDEEIKELSTWFLAFGLN